ncbi:hypothetical protein [Erythrobacter aureus]|uniref:Uncharacterized protein n=1 Tax=Erythrobacter aureus TaxID=2182384 RepID=A0A345YJ55_9SPHN|nr:hypothetical protein [Erythrobacter aureus]AXK43957.1 hypothetical protein DVR09_16005 [Erythrobacter aureus]
MGHLDIPTLTGEDSKVAYDAMFRELGREDPDNHLEGGLRIASVWSAQNGHSSPMIDERRLELAYARIVAREREGATDPVALSSKDYARMLVVDASLQREAEKALKLDLLDRQERFSWMNPDMNDVPWVRNDTSPTVMNDFAEADLKALASGNFEDMSKNQRSNVELMLLRGASPRSPEFEAELDKAAEHEDSLQFIPMRKDVAGLTAEEFGGVVDRMAMVAPGQRPAYDARPQYNPFSIDERRDGLQTATVNAVVGGRVKNPLEQATRIALEFQQERGIPVDAEAKQQMECAVARFVSSGDRGVSPVDAAKVLIVDTAMQRVAREKLEAGAKDLRKSPSVQILEDVVGKGGYPIFTKLESEKQDTLAVAQGRFSDLTDKRGMGSAVYLAIHRSGRTVRGDTGEQLDRLAKANRVGKEPDKSWVKKSNANRDKARAAIRKLTRGPAVAQPSLFKDKGRGR